MISWLIAKIIKAVLSGDVVNIYCIYTVTLGPVFYQVGTLTMWPTLWQCGAAVHSHPQTDRGGGGQDWGAALGARVWSQSYLSSFDSLQLVSCRLPLISTTIENQELTSRAYFVKRLFHI